MAKKQGRDRTDEEVARDFAMGTDGDVVFDPNITVNDDPEPDFAALAGLTTVGTVESDSSPAPVATPIDPTSIPEPTMANIMLMLVKALETVAAGSANSQQMAAAALDQAARQQQPDNKFAPAISDFNPQGDLTYPRPPLKCQMFIPWEAEQESLTYEEIELLNLLESGEYGIRRNDGLRVNIKVRLKTNLNGKPDTLLMNSESAYNEENSWMMPGLVSVLRQILAQRPDTKFAASKVLTMEERIDMVRNGSLLVSVGQR